MAQSVPDHDCERYSVEDHETGESICVRCGMVVKEPDTRSNHVQFDEGRALAAQDHYIGNPLLNSETENMDYISRGNMGLAYKINGGGKDYLGHRVKTSLNFAYQAGNIAGGKAMVMREDPLTGEAVLKFNAYDKPMLTMIKERANSELARYRLSAPEMVIVAKECKRMVSQLFFSELLEYAWMAAVLNAGILKEKDRLALEGQFYKLMEPIRIKILSRCDSALAAELTKPAAEPIKTAT